MASVDYQDNRICNVQTGPKRDGLGRGLFLFHAAVGMYLILGWLAPNAIALAFYMVVLPIIAVQWLLNQGSCVLNNFETWLRHGRWRDPRNNEEAGFLAMLAHWLFRWRPSRQALDAMSYATVAALWILAFVHFSLLPAS